MFFASDENKRTIDEALAMHFVRSGREQIAESFLKVGPCSAQMPFEHAQPSSLHHDDGYRSSWISLTDRRRRALLSPLQESGLTFPQDKIRQFSTLHKVTNAIRQGELGPAFE